LIGTGANALKLGPKLVKLNLLVLSHWGWSAIEESLRQEKPHKDTQFQKQDSQHHDIHGTDAKPEFAVLIHRSQCRRIKIAFVPVFAGSNCFHAWNQA
jgi:hypothetical protein